MIITEALAHYGIAMYLLNYVQAYFWRIFTTLFVFTATTEHTKVLPWLKRQHIVYCSHYASKDTPAKNSWGVVWVETYGYIYFSRTQTFQGFTSHDYVSLSLWSWKSKGFLKQLDEDDSVLYCNNNAMQTAPLRSVNSMINFRQCEDIIATVRRFYKKRDAYIRTGRSHRLGLLLYGPPGYGKSSMVKVLASHFKKTVKVMNLKDPSSQKIELNPYENQIVLIEDFDSHMADSANGDSKHTMSTSALLALLDGTTGSSNTIFLVTANSLKNIPAKFFRPGRIDERYKFTAPSRDEYHDYLLRMYPEATTVSPSVLDWAENKHPSELQYMVSNNTTLAELAQEVTNLHED